MANKNLFPTFDKWTIVNGGGSTEVTDSLAVTGDGYSCSFTVTHEDSYLRYRIQDNDIKNLTGHTLLLHVDNFTSTDNQPKIAIRIYTDLDNNVYSTTNLRYRDGDALVSMPLDYEIEIPADCQRLDIRFSHDYASQGIDPPATLVIENANLVDTYVENLTTLNFHKVLEENLPASVTPGTQHIYFTTDGSTINSSRWSKF